MRAACQAAEIFFVFYLLCPAPILQISLAAPTITELG